MPQNTPNHYSNIHFGPPGYPGGASRAQNLKIAVPGGYLKDRIWVLWNFCPIFGHLTLFRWLKLQILTLVVYPHPLHEGRCPHFFDNNRKHLLHHQKQSHCINHPTEAFVNIMQKGNRRLHSH